MLLKDTGWRKFTQLMTNHILGHKHRDESLSIMDHKSVAHKIWRDHGLARPCFDRLLDA